MNIYCLCEALQLQTPKIFRPVTDFELLRGFQNRRVSINDMSLSTLLKKLVDTLNMLSGDFNTIIVFQKKKHERRKASDRRSTFIGVSKNGPSWQSMITINKRKTYIGTYKTEREAAIAFDFYSMLIHTMEGKTNFSYTKGQIWEMINNFNENDQILNVYQLSF